MIQNNVTLLWWSVWDRRKFSERKLFVALIGFKLIIQRHLSKTYLGIRQERRLQCFLLNMYGEQVANSENLKIRRGIKLSENRDKVTQNRGFLWKWSTSAFWETCPQRSSKVIGDVTWLYNMKLRLFNSDTSTIYINNAEWNMKMIMNMIQVEAVLTLNSTGEEQKKSLTSPIDRSRLEVIGRWNKSNKK